MLDGIKSSWRNPKGYSSNPDNNELQHYNNEPNNNESIVSEDSVKHIELVMDLSRADHVPDLEEDEEVEDPGDVTGVLISIDESLGLPEWLSINLVLSSWSHAAIIFGLWISECNVWLWDDKLSPEHEDADKEELEYTHVEDMLDHLS